jgi:hypothetical protein
MTIVWSALPSQAGVSLLLPITIATGDHVGGVVSDVSGRGGGEDADPGSA